MSNSSAGTNEPVWGTADGATGPRSAARASSRSISGTTVLILNRKAQATDVHTMAVTVSTTSGSRSAQPLGPAGEFGPSGSALPFLGEDAVCAHLDRVEHVIVIWQDEHDRTAFTRVATVALDFVTAQP
jgi:hypothetical protein